jgi:hypothetical protein
MNLLVSGAAGTLPSLSFGACQGNKVRGGAMAPHLLQNTG